MKQMIEKIKQEKRLHADWRAAFQAGDLAEMRALSQRLTLVRRSIEKLSETVFVPVV